MNDEQAYQFIHLAIQPREGVWADLGAGAGTFTKVISSILGKKGKVYAIDKSSKVLSIPDPGPDQAAIIRQQNDFTQPLDLPPLDGILLANALHYVKEQKEFLRRMMNLLKEGGRLLLIEYDRESANPWVPYPVSVHRLHQLCEMLSWPPPEVLNRQASSFGRVDLYAAVIAKPKSNSRG